MSRSKIDLRRLSATARVDLESRCWLAVSEGRALADVAAEHGLQYHQLTALLGRIRRRVVAVSDHHAREQLADHLIHLDRIRAEAMAAWVKSKEPIEQLGERTGSKGTETTYSLKGSTGNPAFLAEARAALAELREVLGLVDRLSELNGESDPGWTQAQPAHDQAPAGRDPGSEVASDG